MGNADLENRPHPAASSAYRWLKGYMVLHPHEWAMHKEALASTALSGNFQADVCMSTIKRLADGEPVGDRYILGLAWTILKLQNFEQFESVEDNAIDKANEHTDKEI